MAILLLKRRSKIKQQAPIISANNHLLATVTLEASKTAFANPTESLPYPGIAGNSADNPSLGLN